MPTPVKKAPAKKAAPAPKKPASPLEILKELEQNRKDTLSYTKADLSYYTTKINHLKERETELTTELVDIRHAIEVLEADALTINT